MIRLITYILCSHTAATCPIPILPQEVLFVSGHRIRYASGDLITMKCKVGFMPTDQFTAVCSCKGAWSLDPAVSRCSG